MFKNEKMNQLIEQTHTELNPLSLPPEIWASSEWEQLTAHSRNAIFVKLLNHTINRAKRQMPEIYSDNYSKKKLSGNLESIEDFWNFPLLVKDSTHTQIGFREKIFKNPEILKPRDVKTGFSIYKSGGTLGSPTPTYLTKQDLEIEANALSRCFKYMGFTSNDIALSTYNPTHKGGELIKESLLKLGVTYIPRRTTDTPKDLIETIKQYKVNALMSVQGPITETDTPQKGTGVDFLSLIQEGHNTLEKNLTKLFVTGYSLIPELTSWAETYGMNLATTLGSTEAIPQATSTLGDKQRNCKHNQQHLILGPHYTELLTNESGTMVPVKKGEVGILAYTTLARNGTLYVRYAPGDVAKLSNYGTCKCGIKTDIITDICRADIPEEVINAGCCIG